MTSSKVGNRIFAPRSVFALNDQSVNSQRALLGTNSTTDQDQIFTQKISHLSAEIAYLTQSSFGLNSNLGNVANFSAKLSNQISELTNYLFETYLKNYLIDNLGYITANQIKLTSSRVTLLRQFYTGDKVLLKLESEWSRLANTEGLELSKAKQQSMDNLLENIRREIRLLTWIDKILHLCLEVQETLQAESKMKKLGSQLLKKTMVALYQRLVQLYNVFGKSSNTHLICQVTTTLEFVQKWLAQQANQFPYHKFFLQKTTLDLTQLLSDLQFNTNPFYLKIKSELERLLVLLDPKYTTDGVQNNSTQKTVPPVSSEPESAKLNSHLASLASTCKDLQKYILLRADYSVLSRGLKTYKEITTVLDWVQISIQKSQDKLSLQTYLQDLDNTLGRELLRLFRDVELRLVTDTTQCFEGSYLALELSQLPALCAFPREFGALDKINRQHRSKSDQLKIQTIRESQVKLAQVSSSFPSVLMVTNLPLISDQGLSWQPDMIFWILKEQIGPEMINQLLPIVYIYNQILTSQFTFLNFYTPCPYLQAIRSRLKMSPEFQTYLKQMKDILDTNASLLEQVKSPFLATSWFNPLNRLDFVAGVLDPIAKSMREATNLLQDILSKYNIKLELRGIQIKATYQSFTNFVQSRRNQGKMSEIPGAIFYDPANPINTNPVQIEKFKRGLESILALDVIEKYQTRDRKFFHIKASKTPTSKLLMSTFTLPNLLEQARQAYLSKDFHGSARTYIEILNLSKLDHEIYLQILYNLGLCLRELGQLQQAHQVFEKISTHNPNFMAPSGQSIWQIINQNLYFWVHLQDI